MPNDFCFRRLSVVLFTSFVLASCGADAETEPSGGGNGTGGGSGGGGGSSNQLTGIAPIGGMSGFLTIEGDEKGFSLSVKAFDDDSGEPVSVSQLRDSAISINSTTGERTRFEFTSARTAQCNRVASNQSSEAILMFDRSGSISSSDPSEQMLDAGVEFANLLGPPDRAAVAAFSTAINGNIEYLTSGFTSNSDAVATAIRTIRAPGGGTPLWSSMKTAIETGGYTAPDTKALITFSDGENTESGSRGEVLSAALNNDVKLYSVSLRNSNSGDLDALSLNTGGLAWSTEEASQVLIFAKSLSKVLDGNFVDCSVGITVNAIAENYNQSDVILGPARSFKPTLNFDYNLNGNSGTAVNSIVMPFSAGAKIGTTESSRFGTADLSSNGAVNNCIVDLPQCATNGGARFTNVCSFAVTAHICSEQGVCETKAFPSATGEPRFGELFRSSAGRYTIATCANINDSTFQPVILEGASPNYSARPSEYRENFRCLYSERLPVSQQPTGLFDTDRNCPAN